jgi:nucleoside-diphosphate-sugar epimerase
MKRVGVVGASGFIGGHLSSRYRKIRKYGRENISELAADKSDLVVIAAAPATKWLANSDPINDLNNINGLIESLKCIEEKECVLISTIDVFPVNTSFDERDSLPLDHPEPYGANRGHLERQLAKFLPNLHIIRLPGMYGPGLKKNLIFDLMNGKPKPVINSTSKFQFYDVRSLPAHIALCLDNEINVLNLATEPISVFEIYEYCFNIKAPEFAVPRVEYKMVTRHSYELGGREENYLISKDEVLVGIKRWSRGGIS